MRQQNTIYFDQGLPRSTRSAQAGWHVRASCSCLRNPAVPTMTRPWLLPSDIIGCGQDILIRHITSCGAHKRQQNEVRRWLLYARLLCGDTTGQPLNNPKQRKHHTLRKVNRIIYPHPRTAGETKSVIIIRSTPSGDTTNTGKSKI